MNKSLSIEQLRTEYRRARQLHQWTSDYLEGERIYLTGRRRNMREVETTLGGHAVHTKPVHGRLHKAVAVL